MGATDSDADSAHRRNKKSKKEKKSKRDGDKKKKKKKDKKKEKKRKREDRVVVTKHDGERRTKKRKGETGKQQTKVARKQDENTAAHEASNALGFEYKYILAPMVGASELAFRLLCRKYGAQLAYTPMMSSTSFASDAEYRKEEFQTIPEDRPLVCHFSANSPKEFAAAAKFVEDKCDAIDLNLGCPQRTAHVGHFGSYLLGPDDRQLVLDIVRTGSKAVSVPIFVKIRLLDTVPETIELCRQLRDAGASLIAVHARYRASFERKGPGARDGPALLDQVLKIKEAIPDIPIVSNGNVIDYDDVRNNLEFTKSDGIMSAEGILDNPALYLPRLGSNDDEASENQVQVADPSPLAGSSRPALPIGVLSPIEGQSKKKRKLEKKLRQIKDIEAKARADGEGCINDEQREKLSTKSSIEEELSLLDQAEDHAENETAIQPSDDTKSSSGLKRPARNTTLAQLYDIADDKIALANEYIALARQYPVKIRSVVFHVRRMCKEILNQFQLMDDCVSCTSIDEVQAVLRKLAKYRNDPSTFTFDREKAAREREALENKRREEGKRKAYEGRMMRKAKREGRADLEYYLRMGAEVPTVEIIQRLRGLSKDEQMAVWKKDHSQHCLAFHLDGCKRDRTCAFLHVAPKGITTFDESDEVAG